MNPTPVLLALLFLPPFEEQPLVPPEYRIDWPQSLGPGVFGRTEVGRFVPYHARSAALQWGSSLVLAYAPFVHDFVVPIASDVTSFTVYPARAGEDRDELLVATTGGLLRLRYDEGLFPPAFLASPVPGTGSCAGALDLVCCDLDRDGRIDIAAIDADTVSLRVLLGGSGGTFVEQPVFQAAGALRDIEAILWDGDSERELAVSSTWGTQVFDWNGGFLWGRFSAFPDAVMAVLPAPSSVPPNEPEQLAIVQRNASGTNQLLTLFWATGNDNAISLTNLGVVNGGAGDWNGDGYQDLALSHQSSHDVRILLNRRAVQATGTTFSTGVSPDPLHPWVKDVATGGTGPAPTNQAEPCLGDMDDNGAAELVFGAQDPGWLVVHPGEPSGELGEPEPRVGRAGNDCSSLFRLYDVHFDGTLHAVYGEEVCPPDRATVELELENVWPGTSLGNPSLITHLELILWHQGPFDETHVDASALRHVMYPITSSAFRAHEGPMRIGFGIPVPLPDPDLGFQDRFYVEVRPVHYSPATHSATGPLKTYCAGFTLVSGPPYPHSVEVLLGNEGAASCPSVTRIFVPDPVLGGGYIGGLVQQFNIPPPVSMPTIPLAQQAGS